MTTQTTLHDYETPHPNIDTILGTHTYNAIYNPGTVDVNVNILTGKETTTNQLGYFYLSDIPSDTNQAQIRITAEGFCPRLITHQDRAVHNLQSHGFASRVVANSVPAHQRSPIRKSPCT